MTLANLGWLPPVRLQQMHPRGPSRVLPPRGPRSSSSTLPLPATASRELRPLSQQTNQINTSIINPAQRCRNAARFAQVLLPLRSFYKSTGRRWPPSPANCSQ